jgi:hypothetical protein
MQPGYAEPMAVITSLILAADPGAGGQDPGGGLSAVLIVVAVLLVLVLFAAIFALFHRTSGRSRGGVEPRRGEFRRGGPPFESVGRKR